MRKVEQTKRRNVGVWRGVATLVAAISGVSGWGNVAAANAPGVATAPDATSRLEAAANDVGANAGGANAGGANDVGANDGFWPRLGTGAVPGFEFNENAGFDGASADGVGAASSASATRRSVETANFVGYSGGSGFAAQENAVVGRTRLVDWTTAADVPTPARDETENANPNRTIETPTPNVAATPVGEIGEIGGNGEIGETAGIGESGKNNENGAVGEGGGLASRSKTPILRDGPVSRARGGGSFGGALVSTFGALTVVLGAFFALVAFFKRTGPLGGGGSALEIVDSTPVGDKARLLTIRWGNRLILAAKTPEKIAPLAEITDADEASAMLAEIERRKENATIGKVGEKTAAIWKRGLNAASVWRKTFEAKGRRR